MKPDAALIERRLKEDALVVAALKDAGVHVQSVYDLVNDRRSHPDAVAALLEVLPRINDDVIKEGIVRALTDPSARGVAARPLIMELRHARDFGEDTLAWAIGNALTVVADHSVLDDLLELASDERVGHARQTIALALARFKRDPRVVQTLIALLQDEHVAAHALISLRKLKAVEAKDHVKALLGHRKQLIRREAEKALKILERADASTSVR